MKLYLMLGLTGLLLTAAWVGVLPAVQSVNVEQKSTQVLGEGTFEEVVLNNLGELKLARKLEALLKDDKEVVFVNALAADSKGTVYAATAPHGKLFRVSPSGACDLYYTAKEKTLQSLAVGPKDELYVGTGGGVGRILRVLAKDKARPVLEKPGLAYVWSMAVLPDGRLVAGTGPNAELILVAPGPKPSAGDVLFKPAKAKQKNILSVAADGAETVYFGTDTDGLIFKFDLKARRPFLLYDAKEAEIACLALAPDGVLYAGTSDPRQGADGEHAPGEPDGRPVTQPVQSQPAELGAPAGPTTRPDKQAADPRLRRVGQAGKPAAGAPTGGATRSKSPTTQPERPATVKRPQPKNGPPPEVVARMRAAMAGRRGGPGGPEGGAGNAVYRIDTRGFVTEVLRQPTLMLALLLRGDRVIVATGSEGRVLAVTPGSEEIATLAKPKDVKQVLALAPGRGGTIYVGTANKAIVGRIGPGHSPRGTFTSKPIDAKQISRWGVIRETSDQPQGTSVRVQTRSGNLAEPDDSLWSAWSGPVAAVEPVAVSSPPARFIQYRLVLTGEKPTVTPVVRSVTLSYVNENQAPKVQAVKAIAPGSVPGGDGEGGEGGPGPREMRRAMQMMAGRPGGDGKAGAAGGGFVMVMWQASDPNSDPLQFTLSFRREGTQAWVPMVDKPVREPKFRWVTQGLPDGRYRIKVVASDLPGNPASVAKEDSRVTDPFIIDNTAPTIENFRVVSRKGAEVALAADGADALSRLASAQVRVSSTSDGQVIQPLDGIWDQRHESFRFTVDLSDRQPGPYLLILTVTDAAGNAASAALEVVRR